jgi:hypothetical protein
VSRERSRSETALCLGESRSNLTRPAALAAIYGTEGTGSLRKTCTGAPQGRAARLPRSTRCGTLRSEAPWVSPRGTGIWSTCIHTTFDNAHPCPFVFLKSPPHSRFSSDGDGFRRRLSRTRREIVRARYIHDATRSKPVRFESRRAHARRFVRDIRIFTPTRSGESLVRFRRARVGRARRRTSDRVQPMYVPHRQGVPFSSAWGRCHRRPRVRSCENDANDWWGGVG